MLINRSIFQEAIWPIRNFAPPEVTDELIGIIQTGMGSVRVRAIVTIWFRDEYSGVSITSEVEYANAQ